MNPGPIEESAKVATTVVEGFKNNPACLAAILLAALFAVLTFYAMQRDADRRARTVDIMLTRCVPNVEAHPAEPGLPKEN